MREARLGSFLSLFAHDAGYLLIQAVEEYLLSTEHEVPIYFTRETEDTNKLLDDLEGLSTEKAVSAAQGE
jgi:hypothetical protein